MFQVPYKRLQEVLDTVGLSSVGNKLVRDFSLGMKQRLGIANALIHSPQMLILDEPTNGLDPLGIIEMRGMLRHLSEDTGITILISSHLLNEIENIADYIGIIDNGRLIREDEIKKFQSMEQGHLLIEAEEPDRVADLLNALRLSFNIEGESIKIFCDKSENYEIIKEIILSGIYVANCSSVPKTLEDQFLNIVSNLSYSEVI